MDEEVTWQIIHEFRQETIRLEHAMASPAASSRAEIPSPLDLAAAGSAQEQAFKHPQTILFPHNPITAIQQSLVSGRFSDLTVIHQDRKWSAHRLVVCSQSSVLESMVKLDNEQNTRILDLSEYDGEAVVKVIEYLYTGSYTTLDDAPTYSLPLQIKLFVLANKLKVHALDLCVYRNFGTTLAERVEEVEIYFAVVMQVYAETTPEFPQLRHAVVQIAVGEMARFLTEQDFRTNFVDLLNNCPEFMVDVLAVLSIRGENATEIPVLCEDCGPRIHDPYEIAFLCRNCKKEGQLEFL